MYEYQKRFEVIKNHCEDDEVLQLFKNLIKLSSTYGDDTDNRLILIDLLLDELVERGFYKN